VGAAALPAVSRDASAQAYPTRPITMIVPAAAGKQYTSDSGTGYSHLCRTGISQDLVVGMERAFRAQGHTKGHHRQTQRAAVEALADPAVRSRLADLGSEVFPPEQQTPEALGALVKADAEKWWPVIKELGIKAE
jgi:tripartite-type tricarboxylate transporter receptor subunit TctC